MGIRFQCHHCDHPLHVKNFQAGKRGRCPKCNGAFRIPTASAMYSLDVDARPANSPTIDAVVTEQSEHESILELDAERTSDGTTTDTITSDARTTAGFIDSDDAKSTLADSAIRSDSDAPMAIFQAPKAIWYLRSATGDQFGPANANTMLQWLHDQHVGPDQYVWRDGWSEWMLAAQVFGDYFAKQPISNRTASLNGTSVSQVSVPSQVVVSTPSLVHEQISGTTEQRKTPASRNQRRTKRLGWLIAVLLAIFLVLLTVLIYVLL